MANTDNNTDKAFERAYNAPLVQDALRGLFRDMWIKAELNTVNRMIADSVPQRKDTAAEEQTDDSPT